jgi:hypothetical protein
MNIKDEIKLKKENGTKSNYSGIAEAFLMLGWLLRLLS